MESTFDISPDVVKTVLTKGWLTHDAMWFFCSLQEFGIEKTNELNLKAIALMGPIETRRMLKALGMREETFDGFDKVWRFFNGAKRFVIPEWMDYELTSPRENVVCWEWRSCFAHDGIMRLGVLDQYRCGVMFRIESWLKELGLKYEMKPKIDGCLMRQTGKCRGEIHFYFD